MNDLYSQLISCTQVFVFSFAIPDMDEYFKSKFDFVNKLMYVSSRKPDTTFVLNALNYLVSKCIEIVNKVCLTVGSKMKYTGMDTRMTQIQGSLFSLSLKIQNYPNPNDSETTTKTLEQRNYRSQVTA